MDKQDRVYGGCCEKNMVSLCHHMHIHYLPVKIDINPEIKKLFDEVYEVNDIYDMTKIRTEVLHTEQYLYFQKDYLNLRAFSNIIIVL